jgi:hypothetical protein
MCVIVLSCDAGGRDGVDADRRKAIERLTVDE